MTTNRPSAELIQRSREMRHTPTPAEQTLWRHLRNRQMNGLKFRRQHPIGLFILDFFCDELHLAIEVDGGGHNEAEQEAYDLARTRILKDLGIQVIRFWNEDVLERTDVVLNEIYAAIQTVNRGRTNPMN